MQKELSRPSDSSLFAGGLFLISRFFFCAGGQSSPGAAIAKAAQKDRSLFLENFMNSSSETVVSASRMVAMAEASPSLPWVTRL